MLQAAEAHYRLQARLSAAAVMVARRTWDRLDVNAIDESWAALAPRMAATLGALQVRAAADADSYLSAVLAEQGVRAPTDGRVNARGFLGTAGDGRPVGTLVYEPVIEAKSAIGAGSTPPDALSAARSSLDVMVATVLQDTARAAVYSGMVARPNVHGWVRMLNTPSCARCAVLAGKWFRLESTAGFDRHPRCDCRAIPAAEDVAGDLTTDPVQAIRAGQVTGLSKANTRAILEDGADVGQVINAQRGMSTAQVFGKKLKITSEGTTTRGLAGQRMGARETGKKQGGRYRQATNVRPMPESIYRIATDRADALRLLKLYGFIL